MLQHITRLIRARKRNRKHDSFWRTYNQYMHSPERKNLTNLTDGGEGMSGHTHTAEARAKMSALMRARLSDPQKRAALIEASRRAHTPEVGKKISATQKQRYAVDPQLRERNEFQREAMYASPEWQAKNKAQRESMYADPKWQEQNRKNAQERYNDPLYRERMREIHRSDQFRELISEKAKKGEDHHMTKLTADEVREMRALYEQGGWTFVSLGKRFGVSDACVSGIIKRKTWKHIP